MPLMFIPTVIFPFVFSKLIFFQILIGLTFPAYLALAWMDPKSRPAKSPLYTAIGVYLLIILLSVLFSVDIGRSWWGNQERMNGLFTVLHFFVWLTMATGLLKRWIDWRRLLNYEIGLSVVMAIVAILQKPFPNILLFPAGDRVGGLLDNPIYMGAYQIFNLSFLALLSFQTKKTWLRALYAGFALIDITAFFMTQSRGAFLGLVAVIGIFTVYYAFFTKNAKAKWSILGSACGFFGLYILAYIFRASAFVSSNGILSRLTNLNATTETRLIAWDIAWKGFLERPLTGWGFDAFHIIFNSKYNPRSLEYGYYETWFDRAHNTIMDVLSMTGIFGLIGYLSIFIIIVLLLWKARKRGWIDLSIGAILTALTIGYFMQNLFVFDHPAAFSMSYLLFAFVIVATREGFMRDEVDVPQTAKSHEAPWVSFGFCMIVATVLVWSCSINPFRASETVIKANQYFGVHRYDEGMVLLKESLAYSRLYDGEQTFLLSRSMVELLESGQATTYTNWKETYDFTKKLNQEYLAKHPRDTNAAFVYARLLHGALQYFPQDTVMTEAQEAEKAYLAAIATSPKRQQIHFGLARLYAQMGQSEKTRDTLKATLDFDQNIGEAWWYYGLVTWLDLKNEDEGTKAVVQAMKAKSPFVLTKVSEAFQVARAAAIQEDQDVLRKVMDALPQLGGGTMELYLDIAAQMEKAGLIEDRNRILNAAIQMDPTLETKFEALRTGSTTSMEESFQMAADAEAAAAMSASSSGVTTSSTTEIVSSTQVGE